MEGGRRWRAEVAGYGRGGGAADLGKGRAVVEMVAVAESCAEALFIGLVRRWSERGRWWRPASGAASLNGIRPRSRVAEWRAGGEAGAGVTGCER